MSTKAFLSLLCSCAFPIFCSFAQPITWIQGARIAGFANADAAAGDPWNTVGNPAGIAGISSPVLALAIERRFMLKELESRALTAVLPLRKHVLGAGLNFFGSRLYQRQLITLAFARAFSDAFSAGFHINYHGLKVAGYAGEHAWTVGAGLQFSPLPRLRLGAAVANPRGAVFEGELYAEIPVVISLGAAWAFSGKVLALLELERIQGFPVAARAGLEYHLHPALFVRAGVSGSPFRQYGGLGLRYRRLQLDLSAASHLQLGFTPRISLCYVL